MYNILKNTNYVGYSVSTCTLYEWLFQYAHVTACTGIAVQPPMIHESKSVPVAISELNAFYIAYNVLPPFLPTPLCHLIMCSHPSFPLLSVTSYTLSPLSITPTFPGYVVSVSDFLMTSLAKLTVKVGKGVKDAVAESEVRHSSMHVAVDA